MAETPERWYSPRQAGIELGISHRAVMRLVQRDVLAYVASEPDPSGYRSILISQSAIDAERRRREEHPRRFAGHRRNPSRPDAGQKEGRPQGRAGSLRV